MADSPVHVLLRQLRTIFAAQQAGQLPDQELLHRFVTRQDEAAFAALVRRHGPMVYNVCRRVVRHAHDAEDAFQAVFLVFARKARSIRRRESVGGWLHGVAYRVASKARAEAVRRGALPTREAAIASDPADDVTWRELRTVLDEELGRLPERYRAPLVLCYLEGRTQDEATRQLGWSKNTFRRRLERGRDVLRGRLTRRGVTLSAGLFATALAGQVSPAAIPATLISATVRAGLRFVAGRVAEGALRSGKIAVLAEGVLKAMLLGQVKVVTGMLFVASLFAAGTGVLTHRVLAERQAAESQAQPAQPPAPVAEQPKPAVAPQARTDRYGDPLPLGAVARLGTARFRAGMWPKHIAATPDGTKLVTVDSNLTLGNCLTVWDTGTGRTLREVRLPKGGIKALWMLPDGRGFALVHVSRDDYAVWEFMDEKVPPPATGPREINSDGPFNVSAVSPDGRFVAAGGQGLERRNAKL
jgi:RNA polymerase sigma factor (sigma-70 family)